MPEKRTKIVATLSTLNPSEKLIRSLFDAGMDVARINTAHGSIAEALALITIIRKVSDRIAIMIDTKGPNIRTCGFENKIELHEGDAVAIGSGGDFEVNYDRFAAEISGGRKIVLDDGEMELAILGVEDGVVRCSALNDGYILPRKSVNVPGARMTPPALTEKDREFLAFAATNNIDFIAHSFVRSQADVLAVREELALHNPDNQLQIIAKIENEEGVEHLDEILDAADGLMVARGDLGIEIPLEEVPMLQKDMIRKCIEHVKPVITATQMLQSMEENPRPTRAEVSDVANAVLDGTDAVMLSGETAQGKYPLKAVEMMTRIIQETEWIGKDHFARIPESDTLGVPVTSFLVKSACACVASLPIRAIVCNTATGRTCRLIAARRTGCPVYGLSFDPAVVRKMALLYGIHPMRSRFYETTEELLPASVEMLVRSKKINRDDLILLLGRNKADICSIFRPSDFSSRSFLR